MNIVIAYDGSDFAKVAIDDLLRAGLPQKANALVVCVVETLLPTPSAPMMDLPPRALPSRVAGTLLQARAETDQAREEASAFARQGSRRVQGLFPHWGVYPEPIVGAPAEAVIQKAIDWQADLIVIGSHGRSALARIVLGSVSKRVATDAPCSVRVHATSSSAAVLGASSEWMARRELKPRSVPWPRDLGRQERKRDAGRKRT
jgi:nucleotide-binding universal stress UspA family protein